MTRSTRIATGAVVCFVLVLVAAVSGLVALVVQSQADQVSAPALQPEPSQDVFLDPVTTQAEVLDVDGVDDGWASADVRFTTEDGQVEVGYVDLGEVGTAGLPQVGDTIDVVHERGQPQSLLRADDPMLTGEPVETGPDGLPPVDPGRAAADLAGRVGVLAVGSLVAAVVAAGLTVLAVRRAPADPAPPVTVQA